MTTITIDPQIVRLREEILPSLARNIEVLNRISEVNYKPDTVDALRCIAKAEALQKVITEQGERLVNVKTETDVLTLVAMIKMIGEFDGANKEGTDLAAFRIMDYLR